MDNSEVSHKFGIFQQTNNELANIDCGQRQFENREAFCNPAPEGDIHLPKISTILVLSK